MAPTEAARQSFLSRSARALLLVLLAAYVTLRGILPALHGSYSDIGNYLTAAKIVAAGGEVGRLYDDQWFQEQMHRAGFGERGKFSPFPPPTALLMLPLARLAPVQALRVVTLISVLALLAAIEMLARALSWSRLDAALFAMLSAAAIASSLRLGQPYLVVSACCILGYYLRLRQRPVAAGVLFGLFAPVKYFPGVLLAGFAINREWRLVLAGVAAAALVVALSVLCLGWQIHATYLSSVLGSHLTANLSMQSPFTVHFQSFDTLLRRLFVYDATANPHPLAALPELRVALLVLIKLALASLAALALRRLAQAGAAAAVAPTLGILGILTLLLAPATAAYHFTLLWLPLALLLDYLWRRGARTAGLALLGCYVLIGFFPYWITDRFEGRGALSVLAYPRLFLLLTMFLVSIDYVLRRSPERGLRGGALPATAAA